MLIVIRTRKTTIKIAYQSTKVVMIEVTSYPPANHLNGIIKKLPSSQNKNQVHHQPGDDQLFQRKILFSYSKMDIIIVVYYKTYNQK